MSKLTAQQIIMAAHGIEWEHTESLARYTAEWAAKNMDFQGSTVCMHLNTKKSVTSWAVEICNDCHHKREGEVTIIGVRWHQWRKV